MEIDIVNVLCNKKSAPFYIHRDLKSQINPLTDMLFIDYDVIFLFIVKKLKFFRNEYRVFKFFVVLTFSRNSFLRLVKRCENASI